MILFRFSINIFVTLIKGIADYICHLNFNNAFEFNDFYFQAIFIYFYNQLRLIVVFLL